MFSLVLAGVRFVDLAVWGGFLVRRVALLRDPLACCGLVLFFLRGWWACFPGHWGNGILGVGNVGALFSRVLLLGVFG